MDDPEAIETVDVVVIGAGQAGLSASALLARGGIHHVLLDAGDGPGGAWRHRWPTLLMAQVNGVHDLPGLPLGSVGAQARAIDVVPGYFADYERHLDLPVRRPVEVTALTRGTGAAADRLVVAATTPSGPRRWAARSVLNATGTWTRPFWPAYPGAATFAGRQLHTADYRGPNDLAGSRVVVVGGGISALGLLREVAALASTTWVTRRRPEFRHGDFDLQARLEAVASVAQRVEAGLPPTSVVAATGLVWTPQLRAAASAGVLTRWPMMDRIEHDGVVWDSPVGPDGAGHLAADVLLWCTGFRPALGHLSTLRLREHGGGVRVKGSRVEREERLWLLGYGPSASTVGASRAAREAVREVTALLAHGSG